MFYYITYDETSVKSGYSNTDTISTYSNLNNFVNQHNSNTPFTFVDNIKIIEINLIRNSQYAYYEIYNLDKGITYHGLIDIKLNKVVYNLQENIQTFIPFSTTEMLAITSTSAYKICIYKNDNSCTSCNNLLLDSDGNKCQSDCDPGKIKLMPEGICINKDSCDTDIYTFNSGETECGLCSYFYSSGNIYKLINTTGCISNIPDNAEYYNENLKLLKCKTNYHINGNLCVPDSCYERCVECTEVSSNINDQKCTSCKEGYIINSGNCLIPPTTVIIPPTTVIVPPTTIIKTPTTVIVPPTTIIKTPTTVMIPPTTVIIPPTTVIVPPTTIIKPPTTVMKPPTTVITLPTTVIIPPTTTIIPPTTKLPTTIISEVPITQRISKICKNEGCLTCNVESDEIGLCLTCKEPKFKKVNYTNNKYSKYYGCVKKNEIEKKYYYDNKTEQYKPCYKLCNKCSGPGNASVHNCLECADNYMFRPGPNPHNNCVVYSKYYYLSPYNEFRPLDSPLCPEEAKYTIINEENRTSCIFDCKRDNTYKLLYNGYCLKECPDGTNNINSICVEIDPNRTYISKNKFYSNENKTIEALELYAKIYAKSYNYTDNHLSYYEDEANSILLYKNPKIIKSSGLKVPDIDFGDCYKEVQKAYNITNNLIVAIVDKKIKNNPSTFYLFFHPETGIKLEVGDICNNKSIQINENLDSLLDEKSDNFELQKALTKQGINIFDINDPYYKDICYDFDNPKKRDMALKDRIKETYVNVTLCDDGCINTGIDLINNVATCDCKFNDVTNNDLIHENAALEYLVGELFDIVNSSNILVMKCYKYILRYFTRSIGGIIILIILALCMVFSVIFFSYELNRMKRYIFSLTEKYTSFLANYSNIFNLFPPRKSLKNKTSKVQIINPSNNKDLKTDNNNIIHKDKKHNTA